MQRSSHHVLMTAVEAFVASKLLRKMCRYLPSRNLSRILRLSLNPSDKRPSLAFACQQWALPMVLQADLS